MLTKIVLSHNFILILSFIVLRWQYNDIGTQPLIEAAVVTRNADIQDTLNIPTQKSSSSSSSLFTSYWCDEDHVDYVTTIPGYVPVVPPSCWYSGYLIYEFLGRTIHTHYTLQIAEFITTGTTTNDDVENYNPLQKPLIYWSS